MRPLASTELPPLSFNIRQGDVSKTFRLPTGKIGWLHGLTDKRGAKFDLKVKDALGRVVLERHGVGNETDKFGELLNFQGRIGEELEILVENVRGADKIDLFLN